MSGTERKRLVSYKEYPFFYSVRFTVLLSAFVFLFWFFDLSIYGITIMLVACGVILATCRDLSPVVPFVFVLPQVISNTAQPPYAIYWYVGGFCFTIIGLAIHLVRFNPFKNYGKIKGFAIGVCLAGLAIALGGVGVKGRNPILALIMVAYGLMACGSVFFFIGALGRDSAPRLSKTVINAILASSAIALLQLFTVVIRSGDPIHAIASKYALSAGYASANYLANIIARSIPIAVWMSVSNKRYSFLWLFAAFICGIGIVMTSSRATLLVALIISVICVIYYFPKLTYKINWICSFCMIIGITMAGIGFLGDKTEKLFATIFKFGFDSNGRFDLWELAVERFRQHPIFGVGLDYDLGGRTELNPTNTPYTPYWYHNTVLQILCCFGIFGIIAFIPYFYHQYRTMIIAKKPAVTALLFVLITIQAISLLDVFFFTPQEFLQMIVITVVGVKFLPENKGNSLIYNAIGRISYKKNKKEA